ncbi:hypothetical protein QYM36_012061 [Artemia franciscana]|uniref:PiggyBac transposable element-derived protein domain-containing protein n=1 Tax=Artemia franciscana TaxID=6661 RepID=A0AA88HEV0_ARTSF|nr:hypothetical protein QYM36_012061 [Artemia franciscana]
MKKAGRGSVDWRVEPHSSIVVTKWYDNKPSHLISSYAGPDPTDQWKGWDKRSEAQIDMNRPNVVKEYNSFMSGVVLSDMLIQLCHTDIKEKKWYMRLIYYFLGVSVVNVWLLYRRNHPCDAKMSLLLVRLRTDILDWLLRGAIVSEMRKVRPPSESPVTSRPQKKTEFLVLVFAMIAWPTGPKWSTKDEMQVLCKTCLHFCQVSQVQRAPLPH